MRQPRLPDSVKGKRGKHVPWAEVGHVKSEFEVSFGPVPREFPKWERDPTGEKLKILPGIWGL